jgi:CRP/FNR family transcriptional regulator, cyclic AMP receptor protein
MDKHMLLKRVPAFARLTDDQLTFLASSVGAQRFERSETVFHQGNIGSVLYIIVSGQVRIYRSSPSGQELTIAILCDNDFFGEMALLDGQPRDASAAAMVLTSVLTLHRSAFLQTLNACPPIAASILEVMANRLRQSNTNAEQLASLPAAQRVARQLLDLALRSLLRSRGHTPTTQIDLDLTQDDLASLSGTTRETVNRVLSGMRDHGLVRIERARVCILSLPKLREVVDAA